MSYLERMSIAQAATPMTMKCSCGRTWQRQAGNPNHSCPACNADDLYPTTSVQQQHDGNRYRLAITEAIAALRDNRPQAAHAALLAVDVRQAPLRLRVPVVVAAPQVAVDLDDPIALVQSLARGAYAVLPKGASRVRRHRSR